MSSLFNPLPHEGIQSLVPYQPGKSIDELKLLYKRDKFIKLASNENPLGTSPKALAALRNIENSRLSYYPAPDYHPLKPKLAKKLCIPVDCLTLSAGSDTLFSLLMIAFALHRDKHILTHDKAFMTYGIQAKILNIKTTIAPINPDWSVNINALIQSCEKDTALIFIANPNNPTGLAIPAADIIHLLNNIPKTTLLVLDEAYYEFANPDFNFESIPLLKTYPNLVITRTFSKAYGLAGLRLGYAISHPEIAEILHRVQLPFMVNQASLLAAFHALDDEAFLKKTLDVVARGKQQLMIGFQELNIPYFPSLCNFLLIDCQEPALPIYQALLENGIIVRPMQAYSLPNHLRISIGKPEENSVLLKTLKTIKGKSCQT